MKTDELLEAIAILRQKLMTVDGALGIEETQRRMVTLSCLREYVREDNVVLFCEFCDRAFKGKFAASMVSVMNELYEQLDLRVKTWEAFNKEFLSC
jgi:hypothetical protein